LVEGVKVKNIRILLSLFTTLALGLALFPIFSPAFSRPRLKAAVELLPATGDSQVAPLEVPETQEPRLSHKQLISLIRQHVKYVFVLYQENRSFDSYFGTFPGVEGIYSQPSSLTPGFNQFVQNPDGTQQPIQPFLIGPKQYASDLDDTKHSHIALVQKMDVVDGKPRMDRFALGEEFKKGKESQPTLADKQFGELAMAHVDGDTIPFLWRWANRFVIFDHIFQLMVGPSGPGNLSIIAAQSGQSQAALHPEELEKDGGKKAPGEPVLNSSDPFWGSPDDKSNPQMPVNPKEYSGKNKDKVKETHLNQTYATLPLSLAGSQAPSETDADPQKGTDLEDLQEDVAYLGQKGQAPISWGWFQEGFGHPWGGGEDPTDAEGQHFSYVTHHNGPQYFGYIVHSPAMQNSLHDLQDFFNAVKQGTLSDAGGVYYVKGGGHNLFGLKSADPDDAARKKFQGDDDHPGGSDSQISEAMLAHAINAIAQSKYWNQCAILITWDDEGGIYDHVPPPMHSFTPDKEPLTDGPRVPFIFLSPFARVHAVVHENGDHGSVVKFVDTLFGLTPLAKLPDEMKGRKIGKKKWGQSDWGPDDALTPDISDLLAGFDPARLKGVVPLLPPDYAEIPEEIVGILPQTSGYGMKDIGIVPVDQTLGLPNPVPADFNPRPQTNPSRPAS
jgi:phospholipase C